MRTDDQGVGTMKCNGHQNGTLKCARQFILRAGALDALTDSCGA